MNPSPLSKRVTLTSVSQPFEAVPIQMKLSACGIETELKGEMTVAVDPLLSNAIGGIQIQVSSSDTAQAAEILAEHRREEQAAEELRARTCPKCNHQNGGPVKRPLPIGILVVLTLGIFSLLYPWPRYKCPDCQNTWR